MNTNKTPRRVLIFGDRNWSNKDMIMDLVDRLIKKYGTNYLIIIHGGAPGADILAGICAGERSVHSARVDALWETRHRGAGPQRNKAMLMLQPHEAHGFHNNIKQSKGSKDMKLQCHRAKINVTIRTEF